MKQRVEISALRMGMFVSELDRPWLETPFLFQGFLVETQDELAALQEICDYVYVDAARSTSESNTSAGAINPEHFMVDYQDVTRSVAPVRLGMIKSIDDRRLGQMVDTDPLKETVIALLGGILNNPEAALWLTRIREQDELTAAHSINVAVLSVAFAHHLGVPAEQLHAIGLGAMLHDIGLTAVSSEILGKADVLTGDEYDAVRRHPVDGVFSVRKSSALPQVTRDIIRSHHERLDGSGYPDKLAADDIPQHVLIVGLADTYDTMVSDRVYRKGMQPSDVLVELSRNAERTFGKNLVQAFIRCVGIYPPATVVLLNTGAVGVVIASSQEARLQPLVLLLRDPQGQPFEHRHVVDLSQVERKTGKRWTIVSAVDPADHGIDIAAVMRDENSL